MLQILNSWISSKLFGFRYSDLPDEKNNFRTATHNSLKAVSDVAGAALRFSVLIALLIFANTSFTPKEPFVLSYFLLVAVNFFLGSLIVAMAFRFFAFFCAVAVPTLPLIDELKATRSETDLGGQSKSQKLAYWAAYGIAYFFGILAILFIVLFTIIMVIFLATMSETFFGYNLGGD